MIDYINKRIEQLKDQLDNPECNDPKRVESKLDAYQEMLAYHKASSPKEEAVNKSATNILYTLHDELVDLAEYEPEDEDYENGQIPIEAALDLVNDTIDNIAQHDITNEVNDFKQRLEDLEVLSYGYRHGIPEVWKNTILMWFASIEYKVNGIPEPQDKLLDPRTIEERALALYPYTEATDGFTGEVRDLNKEKRKSYIYFETKRLEEDNGEETSS